MIWHSWSFFFLGIFAQWTPSTRIWRAIICSVLRRLKRCHYMCDIHMCDMTHSYVRHDAFVWVTRLIHMCDMTHSYVRHDAFICATWLIHMGDMTHSYVRHDSLLQQRYGIWCARVLVDSKGVVMCVTFICVTWLIQMWDMTHSYVRHVSLMFSRL